MSICLRSFPRSAPRVRFGRLLAVSLLVMTGAASLPAQSGIALIQHTSKDAGMTSSSSLTLTKVNTAGNWIAVCVRAGRSGQSFTVKDTNGNLYHQAVQFNVTSDAPSGDTLGIFYAENIAGGLNTITVSDTILGTLRFAILEYSGVATSNSFDVAATGQGTSTSPASLPASTAAGGDLVLGAVLTANPAVFTAGTGFAIEERVPAAPNSKLMVEDEIQASPGAIAATATLATSDNWGAAVATFKPVPGGGGNPPTISGVSPTAGLAGSAVMITGMNFGSAQGPSTVTFSGVSAGTATTWSSTSINVNVPSGVTPGTAVVTVTVNGTASNGVNFTVTTPPPSITSLSPTSGAVTTPVTITGANFGQFQGASSVTFNGTPASPTAWSTGSVSVPVPPNATSGNVVVTVGGAASNGATFNVSLISVSITPATATVGTGASTSFTATVPNDVQSKGVMWSVSGAGCTGSACGTLSGATSAYNITYTAPSTAPSPAAVTLTATSVADPTKTGAATITVTQAPPPPPSISSLTPSSGIVGSSVTIAGVNFGSSQGTSTVTFNNVGAGGAISWSPTSIKVNVPSGLGQGTAVVTVTVNGVATNGVNFTVLVPTAGISLVQHTSKDAGMTNSASLAFPANNTAGNWIAVCIRAGKAGQLIAVSDTLGNKFHQAVLFNMTVDSETLGIFYAENIAGGANTITVSDTISAGTLRFAIFEYSGILSANSSDGAVSAEGVSAAPNSSSLPTTASGDLLLGVIAAANPASFTASNGYLIEESVPAPPNTKLVVEDGVQSLAGSVSAGASLSASDSWGATLAAFKSAGGSSGTAPNITSLSPTFGPAGTAVTITGTNFGSTQGSSSVTFNNTSAAPTSWNTTSISVPVPSGATTGNVVVTVGGLPSNGVKFITGPISVSILPASPTVAAGTTQAFTASVQNDPRSLGVSWTVSGTGCTGAACGTLSSATATSVVYTAPNPAPNPPNVSVVAASVTDNTKIATATVTIGPPPPIAVSVSPATSTVSVNLTQIFAATVQNDSSSQGVNWTLSGSGCSGAACGTLTNLTVNGNTFGITYTSPSAVPSPATVTLTAASIADNTKTGFATVTVSQGIPTSLGWYQIPNSMMQPVCPNISQIQGAIGCQGVIAAWNGGIADTTRNRLLFTGGGHQNYWGNEVYSLNLSDLTLTRINNPVFPSSIPGCTEDWGNPPTTPSTPAARETYSGLAYVQHLDKMWLFGGALGTSGCRSTGLWMLDLPTLTWKRMDPTNGAQETVYTDINYADYDPQTKLVWVYIADNDVLASYNPDTNTMTELLNHNSYGVGAYSNGVLDPKRHLFVVLGAGFAGSYDLTTSPPTFRRFTSQTVGCSGIQNPNYPGLAYDPVQDKIVGWAGGNTVYLFDAPTLTCTAVTYPGGPPAQQTNGTYGRWRYFPALNVFALVNDWKQNAFTLRLTPAP